MRRFDLEWLNRVQPEDRGIRNDSQVTWISPEWLRRGSGGAPQLACVLVTIRWRDLCFLIEQPGQDPTRATGS
jgi:hypothetical protein